MQLLRQAGTGKILRVRGTNSTILRKPEEAAGGDFVEIGGRLYPIVQIGRQWWMAENLDWKWDGLKVGMTLDNYEARANYYDNDEATYGVNGNKYGLLYNWTAVNYLNNNRGALLPEEWHVSSENDWDALTNAVGGTSVAGAKLKSKTGWISGICEDTYGFSAFPAGGYWLDAFKDVGKCAYYWTSSLNSSSYPMLRYFTASGTSMKSSANPRDYCYTVRLCKDATVNIGGRDYPTTRIGNQVWLAENLDWKLPGIEIGASGNPTTPAAWYYNNAEATYGVNGKKYGLLYNWYCISIINSVLPKGWRIPNSDDYNALAEYVGGLQNAGTKLKSTSGWQPISEFPSPNGTDDYGFKSLPSGLRIANDFKYVGNYTWYLNTTEDPTDPNKFIRACISVNTDMSFAPLNKGYGMSLRLVKDAT